MKVELHKSFRFEAAHRLPNAPDGHRCRNLHGHSYVVDVVVEGEVNPDRSWFIDYNDILALCEPVRLRLDHHTVNDIPGLESGTAEMLSIYIWNELKPKLTGLKEIVVHETTTSSCTYRGE